MYEHTFFQCMSIHYHFPPFIVFFAITLRQLGTLFSHVWSYMTLVVDLHDIDKLLLGHERLYICSLHILKSKFPKSMNDRDKLTLLTQMPSKQGLKSPIFLSFMVIVVITHVKFLCSNGLMIVFSLELYLSIKMRQLRFLFII